MISKGFFKQKGIATTEITNSGHAPLSCSVKTACTTPGPYESYIKLNLLPGSVLFFFFFVVCVDLLEITQVKRNAKGCLEWEMSSILWQEGYETGERSQLFDCGGLYPSPPRSFSHASLYAV